MVELVCVCVSHLIASSGRTSVCVCVYYLIASSGRTSVCVCVCVSPYCI